MEAEGREMQGTTKRKEEGCENSGAGGSCGWRMWSSTGGWNGSRAADDRLNVADDVAGIPEAPVALAECSRAGIRINSSNGQSEGRLD